MKVIKKCQNCGKEAYSDEERDVLFPKNKSSKDGYVGTCKECKNKQAQDRNDAKKAGTWMDKRKRKQRSEVGGQRSKVGSQKSEDRGLKSKTGIGKPDIKALMSGQINSLNDNAMLDLRGLSLSAKKIILNALADKIESITFPVKLQHETDRSE